jgi:uncharacterized membrane protein YccF (DUF307 family)
MRLILNIVWLLLAGFWLALGYALAGIIMVILIITFPFGIQAFKIASYALWPFGRVARPSARAGPASVVGNVLWILIVGWWLALAHLVTGVLLALTIIGLPLAAADLKMIPIVFAPFGRVIVDVEQDVVETST